MRKPKLETVANETVNLIFFVGLYSLFRWVVGAPSWGAAIGGILVMQIWLSQGAVMEKLRSFKGDRD